MIYQGITHSVNSLNAIQRDDIISLSFNEDKLQVIKNRNPIVEFFATGMFNSTTIPATLSFDYYLLKYLGLQSF